MYSIKPLKQALFSAARARALSPAAAAAALAVPAEEKGKSSDDLKGKKGGSLIYKINYTSI